MSIPQTSKRFSAIKINRWFRHNSRMLILGFIAILTLFFGMIGYEKYSTEITTTNTLLNSFYYSLQLFLLQMPSGVDTPNWQLQIARFSGALFGVFAAVQLLVSVFYQRSQLLWIRLYYRRHIIICGLGSIGPILVERYLDQGRKVVVIEIDPDNKYISSVVDNGAIVLIGDGSDPNMLHKAGISKAEIVIVVSGDDGKNAEIISQVSKQAKESDGPSNIHELFKWILRKRTWFSKRASLRCYAHVLNLHLCHYLTGHSITSHTDDHYQVEFFNIFDAGARLLLEEDSSLQNLEKNDPLHLVVIGLNQVGESLIIRSGRAWSKSNRSDQKLNVTVIDPEVEEKTRLLEFSHPKVSTSCKIAKINENVNSPGFLYKWTSLGLNPGDISQIYICLEDDSAGLTLGLMLLQKFHSQKIPITVCLLSYGGLTDLIKERDAQSKTTEESEAKNTPSATPRRLGRGFESLRVFDLLDQTCGPGLGEQGLFEDLAIEIHKSYCTEKIASGAVPESTPEIYPWFKKGTKILSEELKEQNRRHARRIGESLWTRGYGIEPLSNDKNKLTFKQQQEDLVNNSKILEHIQKRRIEEDDETYHARIIEQSILQERQEVIENNQFFVESDLEYLSRLEHESWLELKLRQGWKPGPRDENKKTNPYLYPWFDSRLDEKEARQKTRKMVSDWSRLLESVDLQIYKR